MKKKLTFKLLFFCFFICQLSLAQIDVVYNNLVWSDEFNTDGAIDSNKWFQQTQLPAGGSWFNGEVQHYTNQMTNSFVNNGSGISLSHNFSNPATTCGSSFASNFTSSPLSNLSL